MVSFLLKVFYSILENTVLDEEIRELIALNVYGYLKGKSTKTVIHDSLIFFYKSGKSSHQHLYFSMPMFISWVLNTVKKQGVVWLCLHSGFGVIWLRC